MAKIKEIQINKKWCKQCVICVKSCPRHVYESDSDGNPEVVNLENCVGCNICVMRCPHFAIKLVGEKDD